MVIELIRIMITRVIVMIQSPQYWALLIAAAKKTPIEEIDQEADN